MAKLKDRLGKGFWTVEHGGKTLKRKVDRTIKGNFVTIKGKRVKVL